MGKMSIGEAQSERGPKSHNCHEAELELEFGSLTLKAKLPTTLQGFSKMPSSIGT